MRDQWSTRGYPAVLSWIVFLALAILLGGIAVQWDVLALLPEVVIAIGILFLLRPYWGYVMVVFSAMLTHYRFAAGIGHWRPEQILGLFAVLGYVRLRRSRRLPVFDIVTWAFVLWVAINGISSAFAPEWFQSEKIVMWLMTDIFIFVFTVEIVRHYGAFRAFMPFWILGLLALVWGIGVRVLDPLAHQGRAMGTMEEPDIYGTFAVVMLIYGLGFARQVTLPPFLLRTRYVGILISFLAALLSGTRSSLAGLAVAVLLAVVLERSWRKRFLPLAMLVGVGGIGAIFSRIASKRLLRISDASTFSYRMLRVKTALRGFVNSWQHVVIGHGTNSYGQFHLTFSGTGWVPDYLPVQLVTVIYDTGLIGGIAFCVFAVVVARQLFVHRHSSSVAFGSIYAAIAMFVAYQATNGIWFAFTWIVLGLGLGSAMSERAKTVQIPQPNAHQYSIGGETAL